jgi:uncharacterized protein
MSVRAVLDTNVVLSALLFQEGRLSWLRTAWMEGTVLPLVSRKTIAELMRALTYPKFGLTQEDCEELLGDFLPYAVSVAVGDSPRDLPACTDPDDQKFLELAHAGGGEWLVTGDRALLAMDGQCPFRVVSPKVFREIVADGSSE